MYYRILLNHFIIISHYAMYIFTHNLKCDLIHTLICHQIKSYYYTNTSKLENLYYMFQSDII